MSYADYLFNSELFCRSIYNENLYFVKTKIKHAVLTSFRYYNANIQRNLSDEEFEAFQNLDKNTNLVIQK